jgi:tRNA modification GTPase
MRIETDTTICAIATGSEGALRGIVRITGPETLEALDRLIPEAERKWSTCTHARVIQATVTTNNLGSVPVSVHVWPDHRSYTGQPSAELHMLGAPALLREVQAELIEQGIRLAQPGEFTLRAFLAGRMDLTQCEAVLGLIHAEGEHAFRVALNQLAGGLAGPLKGLRQELIYLLADLEAGLDFVDEDIEFVTSEQLQSRLLAAVEQVEMLHRQLDQRGGQTTAYQIAIVGKPNAGKSSLVNALTGRDVSITSAQAGTTRDYVRSRVAVGDFEIDLLDTAGMEDIDDATPRAVAQSLTRERLEQADLVLLCMAIDDRDPSDDVIEHVQGVLEQSSAPIWRVQTKCDLSAEVRQDATGSNGVAENQSIGKIPREPRNFAVSALRRTGLDQLLEAIVEEIRTQRERVQDVVPMTSDRCRGALIRAAESLRAALEAVQGGAGDEVVAGELRLALEDIGEVAGVVVNNDILDALFSRFCIGK